MTASSQFPVTDDLDRLIGDVARDLVAGEPERVSAASVRAGIAASPAPGSALPIWLSVAAVLLVGLFVMLTLAPDHSRSGAAVATRPVPSAEPVVSPSPVIVTKSNVRQEIAGLRHAEARSRRAATASPATQEPYEGLPRLIIPVIERPEALATAALATVALDDQRLEISRIDIAPLQLSALDHEQH
ncbi:MAG: hypothetical protein ABI672_08950 [Vicinamibacteria bacterium]